MPTTTPAVPAVEGIKPLPTWMMRLVNPVMRRALRSRWHARVSDELLVLHLTGRRTGRVYDIPVGYHEVDGSLVALTKAPWSVNTSGGVNVHVTLRGSRVPARAELVEEPDEIAKLYALLIERYGADQAGRRLGVQINVNRIPDHEELLEAVDREHLGAIRIALEA